jgi:hypothetical protein
MADSTQATIAVAAPSFAKRKARALIGWMTEQEGALWISGRQMQATPDPAHVARWQQARQAVTARAAGLDQAGAVADLPPELQPHVEALRAHPWGALVLADMGEPRLIDLRCIRAAQPVIHIEEAVNRVEGLAATDLVGIARVTLPIPSATPTELPVMFDEAKNAYIVSSANPNLRVITRFNAPVQGPNNVQLLGVGFAITLTESYLGVVGVNGRYFIRDGNHRAYGLLRAGINHVPALVREFPSYADSKMPVHGMLPIEEFLGDRPPTLADYLNDAVSVDTFAPITTKMIVVQALEITPLG